MLLNISQLVCIFAESICLKRYEMYKDVTFSVTCELSSAVSTSAGAAVSVWVFLRRGLDKSAALCRRQNVTLQGWWWWWWCISTEPGLKKKPKANLWKRTRRVPTQVDVLFGLIVFKSTRLWRGSSAAIWDKAFLFAWNHKWSGPV